MCVSGGVGGRGGEVQVEKVYRRPGNFSSRGQE